MPCVTPTAPKLKLTRNGRDGAVVDAEAGLGHFAPANCVEANQAAVYAPIA